MEKKDLHIVQVGDVLVSPDIFTEKFCCDLDACKGQCCVEGDAGAPVTLDEIAAMEDALDEVWGDLSAQAQAVIDKQGVSYIDEQGDLVTSIVNGRDCVFTCYENGVCLCALEKAHRAGKTSFVKPVSCALYPIREKYFGHGLYGLNYNRWRVCAAAVAKDQGAARILTVSRHPDPAKGELSYEEDAESENGFTDEPVDDSEDDDNED